MKTATLRALHLVLVASLAGALGAAQAQEITANSVAIPARPALPPQSKLRQVALPEGDVQGFDIDFASGTGRTKYRSAEWLSQGYQGIRFKGAGRSVTHLRPVGEHTVFFDRHAGVVWLEDLTVHCGSRTGIFAGLEHIGMAVVPQFKLVLRNVDVVTDPPKAGANPLDKTTVWPVFANQVNLDFQNVTINGLNSAEHDIYDHGVASADGIRLDRVTFTASGAQQLKVRNSPTEVQFVAGARIVVTRCSFANWYQPGSWRGGSGICLEGSHADLFVDGCTFWAGGAISGGGVYDDLGAGIRASCIMIDDASGDGYSVTDGAIGTGFANGDIVIQNSGFYGGPGVENLSKQIRIGGLGPGRTGPNARKVCRSLSITNCAAYGQRLQWQFSDIPDGKLSITGCNGPANRELAETLGWDVRFQALIPTSTRLVPVSEGIVR